MEEIWKDIYFIENGTVLDYRGLYQVSNLGRVKSLNYNHTGQERILKARFQSKGYKVVNLYKNRKTKRFLVHRLVAQAFLPNPENKECVDHINTIKTDNNVKNLRWCSYKENINNPLTLEKRNRAVVGINIKNPTITIEYASMGQAQKDGFDDGHICSCCKGERKTHKGYFWCYKEDYVKFLESLK